MKKYIRLFALIGALLLGLTLLAGCGSGANYAIQVGDRTVTENDYYRTISSLRSNFLTSTESEDTKDFWTDEMEDGTTLSQSLVDTATAYLTNAKLYALQFDALGLSFAENEEATIQSTLEDAVESSGGMSAFNEYLAGMNYTYEEYLEEVYDSAKKSKVLKHYFGEKSENPITTEEIKEYYNEHNALVKIIYLVKFDPKTGETYDDKTLKEIAQKAQDAYDAALREKNFDEVISVHSDITDNLEGGTVISDNGSYDETVTKAVMAMKTGEIIKLELDYAHMIIKRFDGTADDVFTATKQQAALETICADEIEEMLAEWKANTTVKINKKIIKKYLPEKMIKK